MVAVVVHIVGSRVAARVQAAAFELLPHGVGVEVLDALDAGLPFTRLVAGPRDLLAPLYETEDFKNWATKYSDPKLVHGPMVGAVTDSSASFWVRTAHAAARFAVIRRTSFR